MPTRKNKDITRIVNRVNKSRADFVNRLKDPNRLIIPDWEDSRYIATHKLGVGTDNNGQVFIYPNVQNINGKLIDFTNPKFSKWDGMDSAIERGDTVHVNSIQEGLDFTENYKKYYPKGKSFKCGGRRKAQLGLDIQYGGRAIPIARNMVYFDGNSHSAGGIGVGNDLEVEGGEVGEKKGNTLRIFSAVPFLGGISPAQLVMGGANSNKVFKAQEDFKNRNRINDDGTMYKTGGIYIKPSKRGTFTAAAKKRGMGVQEFANKVLSNKEDYSPAMVKKANFAGNASRWKKELGGSSDYYSIMEKVAKDNYKRWGFNNEDEALMHALNDNTYNYRGYYNKYPNSIANADTHWTDEFKTVYHPTFSIESIYSGNKSIYNPLGLKGGYWDGNNFIPAKWQKNKKEFGGNMIYTINGNVKNGLMSARPKAVLGKQRKVEGYGNTIVVGDDTFMLNEDGVYVPVSNVQINKQPKTVRGASSRRDIAYDRQGNRYQRRSDGSLIRVNPEKGNIAVSDTIRGVEVNAKNLNTLRNRRDISKAAPSKLSYEYNPDYPSRSVERFIRTLSNVPKTRKKVNPPRQKIEPNFEIGDQTVVNFLRNSNGRYNTQRTPIHSFTPAQKLGLSSYGWSTYDDPNKGYSFREDAAAVKAGQKPVDEIISQDLSQINFDNNQSTSTPRKGETKPTSSRTTTKSTPTLQDTVNQITRDAIYKSNTPKIDLSKAKMPTFDVSQLGNKESRTYKANTPKSGHWIGQYKNTNVGDWIGLGSNLAGTVASYFMTKNAINKMPDPIKPVMAQAAKLKTRYNVEPQLTGIREAEQMNRAAVRRNTQSSNVSLAREQRLMNEARGARNQLYGQKENIETQLINQDRLNRQSVMRDNVRAYNEYLNRLTATRQGQNQLRISNINNLLSGLTGSVNNILGTIESRRATNNTLRAIAAANPNVDARLIGGFDYYIDPVTKRKYNKNQQYIGTING